MAIAAVIGGSGRMGAWFANFLAANGYKVIIYDKNAPAARRLARKSGFKFASSEARAEDLSDIVVFATPTHTTKTLLAKMATRTHPSRLIVEISSTKETLRSTIVALSRRGVGILSIHPMFGPGADAESLVGKPIIVAHEPRESRLAKEFLRVLKRKRVRIIRTDLKTHDRMVATTLSLPHLVNFAFIQTLRRSGFSLNEVRALGGTTFRLQLLIAEALCRESLHNETSILADNKHSRAVFASFAEQISQMRNLTRRRKQGVLMNQLRKDTAYAQRDRLFRTAYERFTQAVELATPP